MLKLLQYSHVPLGGFSLISSAVLGLHFHGIELFKQWNYWVDLSELARRGDKGIRGGDVREWNEHYRKSCDNLLNARRAVVG